MKLQFSSFEKALSSLKKAIDRSLQLPEDEELRDSVIQRFEYSYELAWKMMKRQIEHASPNPAEIDRLGFRDMLRVAAEMGLISKIEPWFIYREQRNITSHTYDENKAKSVYRTAVDFFPDAKALLEELKKRNG